MSGSNTSWTTVLAGVAAAALATGAHAAPGNGIRLGGSDARLHPFLDVESRYDSNVSYTPANQAVGDLILHVRPGLELKAPGDVVNLEFTGAVDWAQYLGVEADTSGLSKMFAGAALAAVFNRNGAVAPRVDNAFQRQISTTSLAAASSAVVSNANTLSLSVPWKPGGGALVVAANAQWLVESFEKYQDVPGYRLADLGYNQYRFGGEAQWRFLPRTSGLLQAGYFTRVPNVSNRPDEASGFDVLAGLTGLLTPRIAATAKVGYGSTSTKANAAFGTLAASKDASSVLADVSVEWLPADTVSFKTGYTRSLGLDPTVAAYAADGVNAGFRVKLADTYALRVGGRWDRLSFEAISGATTTFLRVDPTVEAAFGKWLNAAVGYVYSTRTASWPTTLGGSPPDYAKNEAFLKVGVTY